MSRQRSIDGIHIILIISYEKKNWTNQIADNNYYNNYYYRRVTSIWTRDRGQAVIVQDPGPALDIWRP